MIGKLTFNDDYTISVDTGNEIITYQLATFFERLGARLIDVAIVAIPNIFLPIIASWLYWSALQCGKYQATVGQQVVRIKTLSTDGMKISFLQATGRFWGNILSLLTLFIGYLMFFLNDKNQCLHDYLAGTVVVREINRTSKPVVQQPSEPMAAG